MASMLSRIHILNYIWQISSFNFESKLFRSVRQKSSMRSTDKRAGRKSVCSQVVPKSDHSARKEPKEKEAPQQDVSGHHSGAQHGADS